MFQTPIKTSLLLLTLVLFSCQNFKSDTLFQRQSGQAVNYGVYEVKKGDSLYSIAWRLNRDYKELARINGIREPYVIYVGQIIKLTDVQDEIPSKSGYTGKSIVSDSKPQAPPPKKSSTVPVPVKTTAPAKTGTTKNASTTNNTNVNWIWPAEGRVVQSFSGAAVGKKGIHIAGNVGDTVKAAASGQVVYSGNSLVGYGNLVIIRHNDIFLTAYAHNYRVLVKEGEQVTQGQKIAEIGASGTDSNKLHFEIRREGKPVDPLGYLPKR